MSVGMTTWKGNLLSGRYEVRSPLGEGGMAFVYRAWDRNLETDVVIKSPHPSLLSDPQFTHRFRREVRALVSLSHPHVVKVLDVGEHEGQPFAVLQFMAGGSLERRVPRDSQGKPKPITLAGLARWLPDVAAALDYVAQQCFVHRDVKPANILFDAAGHAYLRDFGIAKALEGADQRAREVTLTQTGMLIGTPEYMAPELNLGQPFDARVDQYALGVMVYELLCGRRPFSGPTSGAIVVQQMQGPPAAPRDVVPRIPAEVSQVVLRALAKEPAERFASSVEFVAALLAVPNHALPPPVVATSVSSPQCERPTPTQAAEITWPKPVAPRPARPRAAKLSFIVWANTQAQRRKGRMFAADKVLQTVSREHVIGHNLLRAGCGCLLLLATVLAWKATNSAFFGEPVGVSPRSAEPNTAPGADDRFLATEPIFAVVPPLDPKPPKPPPAAPIDPQIELVLDQTVDEESPLRLPLRIVNAASFTRGLRWELLPGVPPGMTIDRATGAFTWTPTESQGPGKYRVGVRVSGTARGGTTETSAATSYEVAVREVNLPPTLSPVSEMSGEIGKEIRVTLAAMDVDLPANKLSYRLLDGPTTATVNPVTGDFRWTPDINAAGKSHIIRVEVSDDGQPMQTATASFAIKLPSVPLDPFAGQRAGQERDDNGLKMKFCWCPDGSFLMGSPNGEKDRGTNEDQVQVTLTGFWLGKYEVTQEEYESVTGENPSLIEGQRLPVVRVLWDEVTAFCVKLTTKERQAGRLPAEWTIRLPTEAEWEYGCRAGTTTATAFGENLNSTQANFNGNYPYNNAEKGPNLQTTTVGKYAANAWGLHDMHGNVWEWCQDVYRAQLPGGRDPLVAPQAAFVRVRRGGGNDCVGLICRSAYRNRYSPGDRGHNMGFRVAAGRSAQ